MPTPPLAHYHTPRLPALTYVLVLALATAVGSLIASPQARFVHDTPSARPVHNVTSPPLHAQGAQVVQVWRPPRCRSLFPSH